MHLNIVKGDHVVGYSEDAYSKYDAKVKELLSDGYNLKDTEYSLNGDMHEYFEKDGEWFTITHLAV